jgi:hypothetical protein
MNSNVITRPTIHFQKEFKRLLKKYPSLKGELAELRNLLKIEPYAGTPLGNNTYKIRLAIKSKGKGKSGGARIISYLQTEIIATVEDTLVNLITIYDKAETDSLTKQEILSLIETMKFE